MSAGDSDLGLPFYRVEVVEEHARARADAVQCEIGARKNLSFSTEGLESYCFASWEPVVFDALLVAAAAEFCDRAFRRPALGWGREISLTLPVHDVHRWRAPDVLHSLTDALNFLTGDCWQIRFKGRKHKEPPRHQGQIPLPAGAKWVIPFSDGLDSWSVANLTEQRSGARLLRVRLAPRNVRQQVGSAKQAFAVVPYKVQPGKHRLDQTVVRSRGFKFTLIGGIAAYLANVEDVLVPESGQGALGPVLVPVGQAYPDYRSHPLFTARMEIFLAALLGKELRYRFPRLWYTKGETLQDAIASHRGTLDWMKTRSCWQSKRWVSVDGKRRQCGICAACMLRRLSVYSSDQTEPQNTYVWENLRSHGFEAGAAPSFNRFNMALREYAIAGTLHLDHLAGLTRSPDQAGVLTRNALLLSRPLRMPVLQVETQLHRLLKKHDEEWAGFVGSLGTKSFVAQWAQVTA
jgi:7-cyano-7-deazaguanine synthase in queuosine biosynthesis